MLSVSPKGKLLSVIFICLLLMIGVWLIARDAEVKYKKQLSVSVLDRHGTTLSIKENNRGHYVKKIDSLPTDFERLLLKKEDRFFYYHPGINPVSSLRALYNYFAQGSAGGSSTLTQQLAKNLLGTESDRTILNKLIETIYAFSIEVFSTKEDILLMYANTVFLGNQIQGFETASFAYFGKPLEQTTLNEQISLLATLSYPSSRNPWEQDNRLFSESISDRILQTEWFPSPSLTDEYSFQTDAYFELRTADINCETTCKSTIDNDLTVSIRNILNRHVTAGWSRNIKNGAVIVIDPYSSELLTMVGSNDPSRVTDGNQINMAIQPRPIGSTVKPLIYAKGFESGLRPYTVVEDREYKYPIATGYSLYPKNYDGQYRGEVTLHEALSNSLNVPSVKVLEFIGLDNFYDFLSEDLQFQPIQDYDSYQYGIALGGLEMDLLTLTHYFTLFPNKGSLIPLRALYESEEETSMTPQSNIQNTVRVVEEKYIELVHEIISDRYTGVNQFGLESNLNIETNEYGVKTGTSRDFHDSWVVGYTPDFVVGVWLGNSQNEPMVQVSGQSGAGAVWHDVMEYLLSTKYASSDIFEREHIEQIPINQRNEWGIQGENVFDHLNLLQDDHLILSIHEGDTFEITQGINIPLEARKSVVWSINGEEVASTKQTSFSPNETGRYEIMAYDKDTDLQESVIIHITQRE